MRLFFIIDGMTGGGAQRVMSNLVNSLVNRGYEVFLGYETENPSVYFIDERVRLVNTRAGCSPRDRFARFSLYRYFRYLYNIRKQTNSIGPDIVVSFLIGVNLEVITALLFSKYPLVCCEHTNVTRDFSFTLKFRRNILYRFAHVVTVLTRRDYKLWRKKFSNVVYMPNPSDKSISTMVVHRTKTVLAVGRVDAWHIKGFDLLIRTWSLLCKKHKDWRLQIVGKYDDSSKEFLNSIVDETNTINIDFLGFRNDVSELMHSASVFCLSSRVEGLPMGLIEAMNAECCCVSFDCITGPNEIIKDGFSGLLAKAESIKDLCEKLDMVIADEKFRKELALNAPASVRKYSTLNITRRWELLFRKIYQKNK